MIEFANGLYIQGKWKVLVLAYNKTMNNLPITLPDSILVSFIRDE